MNLLVIILLFTILFINFIHCFETNEQTYKNDSITQHFSSYSPYQPLSSSLHNLLLQKCSKNETLNKKSENINEKCTIMQIQYIGRHGQRFPFFDTINSWKTLNNKIQSKLTPKVPQWLVNWDSSFLTSLPAGDLTEEGAIELYEIGKRMRERAPNIFDYKSKTEFFPSNDYRFQSTSYVHSFRSAQSFSFSLFESTGPLPPYNINNILNNLNNNLNNNQINDINNINKLNGMGYQPVYIESSTDILDRLKPYIALKNECPAIKDIQTKIDNEKPSKSSYFTPISDRIFKEWDLFFSYNDIELLFYFCIFQANLQQKFDEFCSIFTIEEIKEFEMWMDNSLYYNSGFGMEANRLSGSLELQEVYLYMLNSATNKSNPPKLIARFTHHQSIAIFASLLGLCNDGESPNKFKGREEERMWRTSEITNFSANLVFYLYSCKGVSQVPDNVYVKVTLNEKDVCLPDQPIFLPFTDFWNLLSEELSYSIDDICKKFTPTSNISTTSSSTPVVAPSHSSSTSPVYTSISPTSSLSPSPSSRSQDILKPSSHSDLINSYVVVNLGGDQQEQLIIEGKFTEFAIFVWTFGGLCAGFFFGYLFFKRKYSNNTKTNYKL